MGTRKWLTGSSLTAPLIAKTQGWAALRANTFSIRDTTQPCDEVAENRGGQHASRMAETQVLAKLKEGSTMKRFNPRVATIALSISLAVALGAATVATSSAAAVPPGIENSKKVMAHRVERNKQMHLQQDNAQSQKTKAQSGK